MRLPRIALVANQLAIWVTVSGCQDDFLDVTFRNDHRYYFDNDGNAIDSVNGHVSWIDNQYFWIASPTACGQPVCSPVSYSSPDLTHWTFNGILFDITTPTNAAACSGIFSGCGRPKVVFNEKTKKFVFYGFGSKGFNSPGIPVFTSSSLTSNYTFAGNMIQGHFEFGDGAEDLGLSVIEGTGYVVWTSFNMSRLILSGTLGSIWPPFLQTIFIQQLTDDFLNGTGDAFPVIQTGGDFPVTPSSPNLIDGQVESPDLFKRGNYFYMIGSATCAFCNGTLTLAYRSTSFQGPWTLQIVDSGDTCGGQAMGVMILPPAPGAAFDTVVYHADMFSTSPPAASFVDGAGHSFWTLTFNGDDSIAPIDCSPGANFSFKAPMGQSSISTTGFATNSTDGSDNNASYHSESNWPAASFYQTWTNSKTGILTQLGINLAANNPNTNMTIQVFRYSNEEELLKPFFMWETLGTHEIDSRMEVTTRLKVVRIPLNVTVAKGDRLGFAMVTGPIANPNSTPWSYLLRDTAEGGTDHVLYALNRGRVSLRGDGTISPVYRVVNQELKWYTLVE